MFQANTIQGPYSLFTAAARQYFHQTLRSMPTTLTCWISPSFWIWSFLVPPSLCGGWTFNFFYKVSFEKHPNEGIYTGWFFHWYPQFQYQKENLQLANHSCCSTVNPVTKKGRDWLLGGFLVGTEIGGYQWKNHPVVYIPYHPNIFTL